MTAVEFLDAVQTAVVTALAIAAVLAGGWAVMGRSIWKSVKGWFSALEKRFDGLEQQQAEDRAMAETDREAQRLRDREINHKLDAVTSEQRYHREKLESHTESIQSLRERTAHLEGKEEARREAAQIANAAGNLAAAIKHPQIEEETPS